MRARRDDFNYNICGYADSHGRLLYKKAHTVVANDDQFVFFDYGTGDGLMFGDTVGGGNSYGVIPKYLYLDGDTDDATS